MPARIQTMTCLFVGGKGDGYRCDLPLDDLRRPPSHWELKVILNAPPMLVSHKSYQTIPSIVYELQLYQRKLFQDEQGRAFWIYEVVLPNYEDPNLIQMLIDGYRIRL
jgi:hypothetical protein